MASLLMSACSQLIVSVIPCSVPSTPAIPIFTSQFNSLYVGSSGLRSKNPICNITACSGSKTRVSKREGFGPLDSPTKWDVFISFRGKDTRYTFTDYLYDSLKRYGIRTFRDDPELRSGEVISDALLQAIKESKMYIIVFSENYASSRWCLDELVEILGCYQSTGRSILPVFYYIEPMVVRHQIGSLHEAFREHVNRFDADRLDKWRVTLTNVPDLSGYHVLKNSSQAHVINEIVNRALHEVNPLTLDVAKYQVGLDSRVKDIETLMSNVTPGVLKIGMYGMGGVGKTTLAKVVYNQNYHRFKGSCFLENVREASQTRKGIACLQQKLVNDVLKCKNITIDSADHGIELIRARICSTRILVVIDDMDSRDQLDFLIGPFALGSTIIITTRDEGLLDSTDVEAKYKVNELGNVESRQLFCQHAFAGNDRIPDTFSELSEKILKRARGLPLALKVCGSALVKESEEGWRCFIDKMERVSIVDVEEILLISFHALVDPMLKDIFLDIACFFIGHKQGEVLKILETYYTSVNYNIGILKKKCLLTIDYGEEIRMHDLLLDMGRKIAFNNGKYSRLWISEIIHDVLKENEAIEGIIPSDFDVSSDFVPSFEDIFEDISLSDFDIPSDVVEDILEYISVKESSITAPNSNHFAAETFKRMSKLRFLCLKKVNLTGSFEHAFKDLRWLYWELCPLMCLPSEFYPKKLVFLALRGSKMRTMWEPNKVPQVFENLKTLDLSYSLCLTSTPDFTRLPYLETLNMESCVGLEEVHTSIGNLVTLVSLCFHGCKSLKGLPDSICNLRALKKLDIADCSNLEAIPLNLGNMESLVELNAEYNLTLCELPHSIGCLSKLIELNLCGCTNLKTLPDTICNLRSLKVLNISQCTSLEVLPEELENLENLVKLKAKGLTISALPNSIGCLSKLVELDLSDCSKLKTLPDTICNLRSLKILNIDGCSSLEALPTELGNLDSLLELKAERLLTVTELPDSIGRVQSLENLRLKRCFNMLSISELPSSLKLISLEGCMAMERLPNLSNMKHLEILDITGCSGLTEIHGLEDLTSIKTLYLRGCNLSLLKSILTKHFFQIYSKFGHGIKIYCPSSVFPDWISQDWISRSSNSGSSVSLDLLPNVSHNFLAMILCFKHLENANSGIGVYSVKTGVYSVKTTTNDLEFRDELSLEFFYAACNDGSCMNIVPRTIFLVTDDDDRIEFAAHLEYIDISNPLALLLDCTTTTLREKAEFLGIHLLYKPEVTTVDE